MITVEVRDAQVLLESGQEAAAPDSDSTDTTTRSSGPIVQRYPSPFERELTNRRSFSRTAGEAPQSWE